MITITLDTRRSKDQLNLLALPPKLRETGFALCHFRAEQPVIIMNGQATQPSMER